MAVENIRNYRRNFLSFLASVVLGGIAVSILSAVLLTYINGSSFTIGAWTSLGVAIIFLIVAAIIYAGSQNLQLNESKTWDTSIRLMMDGTTPEREIANSFRTGQFVAVIAYQQLLQASGHDESVGPVMPGFDRSTGGGTIAIVSPPGDRAGANKSELFTRELMDFLIFWWLTWLKQDVITRGRGKARIEFFQDATLRKYPLDELRALIGMNRFLDVEGLAGDLQLELPKVITLSVHREEGLLPEFQLSNNIITIAIRYSIIKVMRTSEAFKCFLRFKFEVEPHRIWYPKWGRTFKRRDRFSSDPYFRGAREIEENLLAFFPPLNQ